ncbi:kinase-like protein [Trametes coccinea BRFM310]|uniref:Kinase-like protein n=1 Tax=Trametes coccinea (strain BRFM310) TaxID=1353009 RepID=A0A1Y2IJB1_TRAC3|nr:kinase-like protein [Trametes coccinea BRFM310]
MSPVTKLPFSLALKSVLAVSPRVEADSTRFVREHTSVPVPEIFDVVESASGNGLPGGYIVMSWIDGEPLGDWIGHHLFEPPETKAALDQLDAAMISGDSTALTEAIARAQTMPHPVFDVSSVTQIGDDFRRAFAELRSIPPPDSDAVSALGGRPLNIIRCTVIPRQFGPFQSQQAFKAAILSQVSLDSAHLLPDLRRIAEPVHAKRHRIVFTHADLHPGNILVKDGRLAGIIDWERAGWYPEYWEYTMIEYHMINRRLLQQFWDAVEPFGADVYRDELALEWALWTTTGDKAIPNPSADELICPRLVEGAGQHGNKYNVLRSSTSHRVAVPGTL